MTRPAMTGDDADHVLREAGLRLPDGISRTAFVGVLNRFAVVLACAVGRVDPRSARREICSLRAALARLERVTGTLRASGFQPPRAPRAFVEDLERWIQDHLDTMDELGTQQARSAPLARVYPHAIGLFAATFETPPTYWSGETGKSSALVQFTRALLDSCRDLEILADARLVIPTDDALRVGLSQAREARIRDDEGIETDVAWMRWEAHYAEFLRANVVRENSPRD